MHLAGKKQVILKHKSNSKRLNVGGVIVWLCLQF